MKPSPSTRLSPVALEIWAYLSAYPDAQDTVEGIAEWWSLEQRIGHVTTQVKKALDDLVNHGLALERRGRDRRVHYRIKRP